MSASKSENLTCYVCARDRLSQIGAGPIRVLTGRRHPNLRIQAWICEDCEKHVLGGFGSRTDDPPPLPELEEGDCGIDEVEVEQILAEFERDSITQRLGAG